MARLRDATLDDLDLLVRHRRGMWEDIGDHSPDELDAADAPYRRWARARLRNGTLRGWVVEARGRAVASGCVWLQPVQPRPGAPERQPYLLSMYTEPDVRGRGHAARIVEAAMRWAADEGFARMTLHAAPMGRALYERLGFARTWEMRADLVVTLPPLGRPRPPSSAPRRRPPAPGRARRAGRAR